MANGEVCGRWQFGDKLFDEGKLEYSKRLLIPKLISITRNSEMQLGKNMVLRITL